MKRKYSLTPRYAGDTFAGTALFKKTPSGQIRVWVLETSLTGFGISEHCGPIEGTLKETQLLNPPRNGMDWDEYRRTAYADFCRSRVERKLRAGWVAIDTDGWPLPVERLGTRPTIGIHIHAGWNGGWYGGPPRFTQNELSLIKARFADSAFPAAPKRLTA